MKLLLIKPGFGNIIEDYPLDDGRMEPLQMAILAALTPPESEVVFYDDRAEPIPFGEKADLVAISVDTFNARRSYEIAGEFRRRGVRVVLGGFHVTLLPEEASMHADAIVVGDAETVWPVLLSDLRHGMLQPRYCGEFGPPQAGTIPRRSIFKGKGYLPVSLVQFGRGCLYDCSFCSIAKFFDRTHHTRPVSEVIREIEADDLRMLLFTDDNLTAHREAAKELFRALRHRKVRWACQVSIDAADDPAMLELMAESGCIGHLVGFDAIDSSTLQWMRKKPNIHLHERYTGVIDRLRSYGFQTWASFILGGEFDTPETIRDTVQFAIANKFTLAFYHILQPYPGTDLYRQLAEEGRLLYDGKWWLHPDFRYNAATFMPKLMSPRELSDAVVWANKEFYSISSIIARAMDRKTNLSSIVKLLMHARLNMLIRQTST
jgi:radical SAM superfamily enzyme YgiQ (UPF0313 family)